MPYLVSSIIAIVTALIILMTRYEADDSAITSELDRVKSMFIMIDGFVNTYIQSGGSLENINFQRLSCDGILLGNIKDTLATSNCATTNTADAVDDDVRGFANASTFTFPKSGVSWQLIPIPSTDTDYGTSAGSAYKLLVDMRQNSSLMSKAIFSESFSSREFCEKMLFGTAELNRTGYDTTTQNFTGASINRNDGLFVCIIFK